jgi:hypothetical protein
MADRSILLICQNIKPCRTVELREVWNEYGPGVIKNSGENGKVSENIKLPVA